MRKLVCLLAVVGLLAGCAPAAGLYQSDIAGPMSEATFEPAGTSLPLSGGILGGLRVGVLAAMAWPQDSDADFESSTLEFDAIIQLDLPLMLGLDVRAGMMTYEQDAGAGKLDMIPVSVMLTYRIDVQVAAVYIGLGAAFVFDDLKEVSGVDADDAVGFKAAVGANFNLGAKCTLGVDVSYLLAKADLSGAEDVDLDNVAAGVTFTYRFF